MPGPYYVKSGAGGSADGSSWVNAFLTLAAAITAAAAGDIIYVSHQHAESSANITHHYSVAGGAANPVKVYCANDGATPPTALATTGQCTATTGVFTVDGNAYIYGIIFNCSGSGSVGHVFATANGRLELESCAIRFGTGASTSLTLGTQSGGSAVHPELTLRNCTIRFGGNAQTVIPARCRLVMQGGLVDSAGNHPTNFFAAGVGCGSEVICDGVDFSWVTGNPVGADTETMAYSFNGCKMGSLSNGSIADSGCAEITYRRSDTANTNYFYKKARYQGTVNVDVSRYLTGDAGDGVQQYSLLGVASNGSYASPLYGEWMMLWNDTTGSSVTATVEVLYDGAADLNDDEVWVEVGYLGDSSSSQESFTSDKRGLLTAAAAQAAGVGTGSWTKTTAGTGWRSQKLHVAFTPQKKGYVRARVCWAANKNIFADPGFTVA